MYRLPCLVVLPLAGCATPGAPETADPARSARVDLDPPDLGFQSGFYLPIDDQVLAKQNGATVTANGNLAVSFADATFAGTVDANDHLDSFEAGIGLTGAVALELSVDQGGALGGSFHLATVALPPFTVGAVEVSPFALVDVPLDGTADAGARISVVAPFHVDTDFAHGSGASLGPDPSYAPEIGVPDVAQAVGFDGSVQVKVTVAFLCSIDSVPVGGPVVATGLGAAVAVDPGADPWWALDGLVDVSAGWTFADPVTGFPVAGDLERLTRVTFPIADAGGPLPGVPSSTRWSEVYDIANADTAAAAVPVGGELVVVEADGNPWLASIDGFGTASWQHTSPVPMAPTSLVQATSGDLVVAGASATDVRIERYDAGGSEVWTRTLTVTGSSRTTCAALAADGADGVLCAGTVTHAGGVQLPLVADIDAAGAVAWATELDAGAGATHPELVSLAVTPAGDILAVGTVDFADGANLVSGTNALVVKLDSQGVVQSAVAVGGTGAESGHRILARSDGSYTIAGTNGSATGDVWLAELDAADTVLWSAAYQSRADESGNGEEATPAGLAAVGDASILVAGPIGSVSKDAWVLRVDRATGMPLWGRTWASADRDELMGVVALDDGLVAWGTTETTDPNGYSDLWLVRTNVDGTVPFDPATGFDTANTAVQWQRDTAFEAVPLAPANVATTLAGAPASGFTATATTVVGTPLN